MNLTTKQTAKVLGCSPSFVLMLNKEGKLASIPPYVKTDKRQVREFSNKVVQEFKKNHKMRSWKMGKPTETKLSLSPTGITQRLIDLEVEIGKLKDKIDRLIQLWS